VTARTPHRCNLLHHISGDLRRNLRIIKQTLSTTQSPTSCPIAYLIPRILFGIAQSDSSLTTAGGYCPAAKFWWYLEWPDTVKNRTLCYIHSHHDP
jgi:hypothetical protein